MTEAYSQRVIDLWKEATMTDRAGREGQQLGNYRLVRLLGRGGFADVYLGEHIYLGTSAAIKVLHTQLENEDVKQFQTEARTIARLVHPHIVRVLEFGVEDTTPFLVVDYAPNGTLRKLHPKGTQLPLPLVVSYILQVADALQYAHDQKVTHRDVKPENMLLDRRNEVLLSDFGLAIVAQTSRYHSTQGLQEIAGTVAYMAPEQIQSQAGPASDQYSLGIVAYEWLCGKRPFHGSFTEIAVKQALTPPPPLRENLPSVPPAIEDAIMKALAKDPKQRFPTVWEFALALFQAYQSEAIASNPSAALPSPTDILAHPSAQTIVLSNPLSFPVTFTPTSSLSAPSLPPSSPLLPSTQSLPDAPPSPGEATILDRSATALPPAEAPRRGISRRALVAGLAGATLVGIAGGGIIWLIRSEGKQTSVTSSRQPISNGVALYTYQGHNNLVWAVAWSPDGKRIASASGDRTVQVWNAFDGSDVYTYSGHADSVYTVAWSPDGTHITSAGNDMTVQVWNATGGFPYTYTGHTSWVWAVAWAPDSRRIASASGDKTVRIWDTIGRDHLYTYSGHTSSVYTVAWSPNTPSVVASHGSPIASAGSDGTIQVWDTISDALLFTYQPYSTIIYAVAWSPDGKRIASASDDHTVRVWDAIGGDHLYTYHGHSDFVYTVAWSPDGKRIASAGDDMTVQVWDAEDGGNQYTYTGHYNSVRAIAWSPNGKYIASGSWDRTVQVWKAR
jgi:WD40 repeat protein